MKKTYIIVLGGIGFIAICLIIIIMMSNSEKRLIGEWVSFKDNTLWDIRSDGIIDFKRSGEWGRGLNDMIDMFDPSYPGPLPQGKWGIIKNKIVLFIEDFNITGEYIISFNGKTLFIFIDGGGAFILKRRIIL
ncbi:MAG: hypothetical protein FWD13_12165 [Treponema sp.]|nr:hypothetical protein [Treponema sp.]